MSPPKETTEELPKKGLPGSENLEAEEAEKRLRDESQDRSPEGERRDDRPENRPGESEKEPIERTDGPFDFTGGKVPLELWDDKKGLTRKLGDWNQKILPDGTVETENPKTGTKVLYKDGKYTDADGKELNPDAEEENSKLPAAPEEKTKDDRGQDKVTRFNFDGTVETRYPNAQEGDVSSRTFLHPLNKEGLEAHTEYAGGLKTEDFYKDGRKVTTEYKYPDNEALSNAQLKLEGNKLTTTFAPERVKLTDDIHLDSIKFEAGKKPVFNFTDKDGKPLDVPADKRAELEDKLKEILNTPLSSVSRTITTAEGASGGGEVIQKYADGRIEIEHIPGAGINPGPNMVQKTIKYPPSNEEKLKEVTIKMDGSQERLLQDDRREGIGKDGTRTEKGQKLDLGDKNEAYILHDRETGNAQELNYTEGTLKGKSYKFGYNDSGELKSIKLPASGDLPEGYSLQKNDEGKWQLLNKENEPVKGEVPGLKIKTDESGNFTGNFEVSKKGDLRHKAGDGIETVLRANGNLDVFNMNDYSWKRTTPEGQAETKYWDGYNWRAGQMQPGPDNSYTITFEGNDPKAPRSVTRIGDPKDPDGGKLVVNFADGTQINADWREQTQQTVRNGEPGPVRHFDGTSYRVPAGIEDKDGVRTIKFADDGVGGPQEVRYDRTKLETVSVYNNERGGATTVRRDSRGYVNDVTTVPHKDGKPSTTRFERDRDGDINKVTLPNGKVFTRKGPEQIPGEAYRMLRERRRNETLNPDTASDTINHKPEGFNHWERRADDGSIEPLDGNFRVTNDGTIIVDEAGGKSSVVSPTGATIEKMHGQVAHAIDSNGTVYRRGKNNEFEVIDNGKIAPNRVFGEPSIMPDGAIRFHNKDGDLIRDGRDGSISVLNAETGALMQRKFDHGGIIDYSPEGKIIASKDAAGKSLFYNYDESGTLSKISTEANGAGDLIAAVDDKGVLREMVGQDQERKPTGRPIGVQPHNGNLLYFNESTKQPEEIRRLDTSHEKALSDGKVVNKLPDGTEITTDQKRRPVSIKHPKAGTNEFTVNESGKITKVKLAGGTVLEAADDTKEINFNPATGGIALHDKKEKTLVSYGPDGIPLSMLWTQKDAQKEDQLISLSLTATGEAKAGEEIPVQIKLTQNGEEQPTSENGNGTLLKGATPQQTRVKFTSKNGGYLVELYGDGAMVVTKDGKTSKFDRNGVQIGEAVSDEADKGSEDDEEE